MSPRPKLGHVRRPQLLKAAAEAIYENGLADTRTSDIAARTDFSAPNVLYYFGSKDALLEAALEDNDERFFEDTDAELAILASAKERLVSLVRRMLVPPDPFHDYTLWIEMWVRAMRSTTMRDAAENGTRRTAEQFDAIVREGQASGEFAAGVDAWDFSLSLLAMIDGLGVSTRIGILGVDGERACALALRYASLALRVDLEEDR